ncbi:MAG: 5'-nucleotidase SurE [Candidatus Anoxychlamydiales bacterium]|nr:5'-nucleotidase SurE [Candidatus Anoxychlamydiales bacterium]
MQNKKNILISNDDGISADGIKYLYETLKLDYNVFVVAPHTEKSASSLSTTIKNPLHIHKLKWDDNENIYQITGTPADCIKMSLSVLFDTKFDLIVSGINKGTNSGRNLLYSGTLGCVIEGAMRGFLGIAFSCHEFMNPNYKKILKYIPKIIDFFLENKPDEGTIINVNFPSKDKEIKGFKLARQGQSRWLEKPDKRLHPEGYDYYWLGVHWKDYKEEANSEIEHLKEGYITATPVHVNELTDHKYLNLKKDEFENSFF